MNHFLRFSVLVMTVVFSMAVHAQQSFQSSLSKIAWTKPQSDFITMKPGINLQTLSVFSRYHSDFGLGNADEMRLVRTDTDAQGIKHYRYQQFHNGYPVKGAVYLLHEKNGRVVNGNGKIIRSMNHPASVAFSSSQAVEIAKKTLPSEKYIWEDAASENLLKQLRNNPSATYYPSPNLMYFDKKNGRDAQEYVLAYEVELYSLKPLDREYIYIDASNGKVLHRINMIQNTDVPATALTKYNGQQPVAVDSTAPGSYRLRETGRGNGIITRSAENGENYATAVDIYDDNTSLFDADDIAAAAHWATEKTYDYYFNTFGRNSFDNNGATLFSYVHYSDNYANAFWDGSRMTYGDGNSQYSAFTTIDICGHEITHAVTTFTADLIYQDESGALNEAFSDIFGTCIEFYADPTPNWLMGEDIGGAIRSMSNPNQFQNPDTYHGTYWDNDPNGMDNGGVHTNCGVGSFWFYLLSEGGNGTNDQGNAYSVTALGRPVAELIAYNTLAYFLTPSSDYYDAYLSSIAAAEALYGSCSPEVYQTAAAWNAVGVGFPFDPQAVYLLDVTGPVTACDLHQETISVRLYYNGCDTTLYAGDTIALAYQFDSGSMVYQDYILPADWNGGDSLVFSFTTPADASTLGTHHINCWVKYGSGTTGFTDSIMNYTFNTLLQQNINLGMSAITSPASDCQLTGTESVTCEFRFYGCDFLPAGTVVDLGYSINGGTPVTESYTLTADMYPSDVVTYTFNQTFNGTTDGTYSIDAWTAYSADTLTTNDLYDNYVIKNIGSLGIDTLGFEETNALDFVLLQTTPYSYIGIKSTAHAPGSTRGLLMTGGNAMSYIDMLEIPSGFNTWQINEFLSAKSSFCVDATSWNTCYMKFGLKQTHGGTLYSQYIGGLPEDYRVASNLRLLANNTQIGGTYNPTSPGSDPFINHLIDLNNYAGTDFVLTIETRNISKDTTILFPVILDNAYIDNVHFFPGPDASDDTTGVNNLYTANVAVNANDNAHGVAALKTTIITPPAHGTAVVNPDQTIGYTANAGYTGQDTLTYKTCYVTDTTVCDEATLSLRVYDGTWINEMSNLPGLQIYPNPFRSGITLDFSSAKPGQATIHITDVIGRVIYNQQITVSEGSNRYRMDLSSESNGVYFITITTNEGSSVFQLTKNE